MSEQKTYTAHEMRDQAEFISTERYGVMLETAAMLRQAADAEEDIAQLKARLDAVAVECEAIKSNYKKVVLPLLPFALVAEADRILRVARGESENENK